MPAPRFYLESPKRGSPWWTVLSAAIHVVAVAIWVFVLSPRFFPETPQPQLIALQIGEPGGSREFTMPAYVPPHGRVQSAPAPARGGSGGSPLGRLPTPRIDTILPPVSTRFALGEGRGGAGGGPDTTTASHPGAYRVIGPEYLDGRLWVRVEEAVLGVVGPSEDVPTHIARLDKAIRERIKAFIDTMPRDSFALPPPPTWTTEVHGRTWGIDPSWIYLGDFKIPTVLLALLPMPQGNYERAQDRANLQRMREDIIQAAQRAQTAEDFRKYVAELRKRKEDERNKARAVHDTIVP